VPIRNSFLNLLFIKHLNIKNQNKKDQKTHALTTRVFFKQLCHI
jgi:hypothetical protein